MCSLPKGTFKSKWKYKSFFKSVKNKLKVELILLSVVKIVTGGLNSHIIVTGGLSVVKIVTGDGSGVEDALGFPLQKLCQALPGLPALSHKALAGPEVITGHP